MDMWRFCSQLQRVKILGDFFRQVTERNKWLGKNIKAVWANVNRPRSFIRYIGYGRKMQSQDKTTLTWSFLVCVDHVCISGQNYLEVPIELFLMYAYKNSVVMSAATTQRHLISGWRQDCLGTSQWCWGWGWSVEASWFVGCVDQKWLCTWVVCHKVYKGHFQWLKTK